MKNKILISLMLIVLVCVSAVACGEEKEEQTYALNYTSVQMEAGEELTLELAYGNEMVSSGVNWASSNFTIVEVNKGVLTAHMGGSVTITATYQNINYTCTVDVNEDLYYSLSYEEYDLPNYQSFTLDLLVNDRVVSSGVSWASSNPTIAVVSSGLITAKGLGEATITARYEGISYTCEVTVYTNFAVEFTSVLSSKEFTSASNNATYKTSNMSAGQSIQLTWNVITEFNTDSTEVEFFSSDEDIATISNSGLITAKNDGVTVITAKSVQSKLQLNGEYTYYYDEFILFVGDETIASVNADMVYYSNFAWQGFATDLYGDDGDENSSWTRDSLENYNASVEMTIDSDYNFVLNSENLPQSGFIEDVDYFAAEGTVAEAKAKYGNAALHADLVSAGTSGEVVFYGDSAYMVSVLEESFGMLSGVVSEFKTTAYTPMAGVAVYENLMYDMLSYSASDSQVDVYEMANVYQAELSTGEQILLNLKSNGLFTLTESDLNGDYQEIVASGIYTEGNSITLEYYKLGQKYSISLAVSGTELTSSSFGPLLSESNISFDIINLVGAYVSYVDVSDMGVEFYFDLTLYEDGTYVYFRRYTDLLDEAVVASGSWEITGGVLILNNNINKVITFEIVSDSILSSIGSIYTGGMDSPLIFERQ